jgi:hypothetical protein
VQPYTNNALYVSDDFNPVVFFVFGIKPAWNQSVELAVHGHLERPIHVFDELNLLICV